MDENLTPKEREFLKMLKKPSFAKAVGEKLKGTLGATTRTIGKAVPAGIEKDFGFTRSFDEQEAAVNRNIAAFQALGEAQEFTTETARVLSRVSRDLFGTTREGNQTFNDLIASMKTFSFMNKGLQQDLGKAAMFMRQFGIDASTTGQIMDTATLAFGMSQEKLAGFARELAEITYKFPGQANEIARNFQSAQSRLAYDSGKIMQVFKQLQFVSSTTGVSFDTLTDKFGDSMDTFEGSANKAGTLNAILGRSVFNAIDLLGKTEAERVDTIVKGVRSSIGGDVNKLGKFQLKAVAEGLGLNEEQTRRLLSGQTSPEDIVKGKAGDPRIELQKQARKATEENTMALQEMKTIFKSFRSDRELAINKMNAENARTMLGLAESIGAKGILAIEEIPTRLEQAIQVFLKEGDLDRAKGALAETPEEFMATRRGGFTGDLLAEDVTVKRRTEVADFLTKLLKPLEGKEGFTGKVKKEMNQLVSFYERQFNIDVPGFGNDGGDDGGGGGGGDSSKEPSTLLKAINSLVNLFTEGNIQVEVTGLQGDTLKALMKTIK